MCRATCEAIAVLKNPPVFARQANIAHGPQQVNNGAAPYAERMDGGTAEAASPRDQALAAVGTVHRPANSRGEGPIGRERGPRWHKAAGARDDGQAERVTPRRS